jgi:hypothetical protein
VQHDGPTELALQLAVVRELLQTSAQLVVAGAGSGVVFGEWEDEGVGLTVAWRGNLDLDLVHGARS